MESQKSPGPTFVEGPPSRKTISRRRWTRIGALGAVAYAGALAWLCFGFDQSAVPTLFLFGPRWIAALPLIVLLALAVSCRSWILAGMTIVLGFVVYGPVTGGRVNLSRLYETDRPALQSMRVVTWNMGGIPRGPAFRPFIEGLDPTLLICQESGLTQDDLPPDYTLLGRGGNRVASRLPIRPDGSLDLAPVGAPGSADRYVVETPDGLMHVVNVHLPTPRPGLEAALALKGRDLSELRRMIEIRAEASRVARRWVGERSGNVIVAGDFNMPIESRIYQDTWSSFENAYSTAGLGWGTTKQTSWYGTRIDHVLFLAPWRCRRAWVGPAMGSDHRPLVADLWSPE